MYSYAGLRVLGFFGTTPLSLANFTMIIGANESYAQASRNLSVSLSEIVLQTPIIEPLFEFLALEEMDEARKTEDLDFRERLLPLSQNGEVDSG